MTSLAVRHELEVKRYPKGSQMSFKLTQTMPMNAVDYYLRCWKCGIIEHAVILRVELCESAHSRNSSLVLLTLLQTFGYNSLKDPPRFVNQFMQLLAELLAFGSILFFPVLLTLESGADCLEHLDRFLAQLIADVFDEFLYILFNPLGDRSERAIKTNDFLFEVSVADVFQLLAYKCSSVDV
jgi:hypothetical protein